MNVYTFGHVDENGLRVGRSRIAGVPAGIRLVSLRNQKGCHRFPFPFINDDGPTPSPVVGYDLEQK